jgi:hypothetical protein
MGVRVGVGARGCTRRDGNVLYMNIVVLIHSPCTFPVKSHILCSGRHCASMTIIQTVQNVRRKYIVALHNFSNVFSTAVIHLLAHSSPLLVCLTLQPKEKARTESLTNPQIEKHNRHFDCIDTKIVDNLNPIRDFERCDGLFERCFAAVEAHFVGAQDVYGGQVCECEEQGDEHGPVVEAGVVEYYGAGVKAEGDDDYWIMRAVSLRKALRSCWKTWGVRDRLKMELDLTR